MRRLLSAALSRMVRSIFWTLLTLILLKFELLLSLHSLMGCFSDCVLLLMNVILYSNLQVKPWPKTDFIFDKYYQAAPKGLSAAEWTAENREKHCNCA